MYAKPTNQPTNQRNYFLNFLKGIGCIGVVFIHIRFPDEFGKTIHKLAQFAVPVFFMISGFYAFSNNTEKLYRKARRIGLITLYAISAYFLFYSVYHLYSQTFVVYFYKLISIKNIGKMLLIQDLSSIGGFHLWFLPALLYCYLFQIIVEKLNKIKFSIAKSPIAMQSAPSVSLSLNSSPNCFGGASEICNSSSENKQGSNLVIVLLIIFLVIHLIISVYKDSNYITWNLKATFLGSGIFWFLLGNYIAYRKEDIIKHLPDRNFFLYLATFISGAMAVTINYFMPNFSEFGIVIYSTSLFLLAIKNPTVHINKTFEFIGEKLSMNIYVLHIMVNIVIGKIIGKFGFEENLAYLWAKPVIVALIVLVISYLLSRLAQLIRFLKQQSVS